MSWNSFLEVICQRQEYALTPLEIEVVMCIQEIPGQTKKAARYRQERGCAYVFDDTSNSPPENGDRSTSIGEVEIDRTSLKMGVLAHKIVNCARGLLLVV